MKKGRKKRRPMEREALIFGRRDMSQKADNNTISSIAPSG